MMKRHSITPRLALFLAAGACLFTLLLGRAIDVQVLRGADFRLRADDNRFFTLPITAERGVFLDRYGQPLVWNTRTYYRVTDPDSIQVNKQVLSRDEALQLMATQSASVVTAHERLYRFPEALAHIMGYTGPVTAEDLQRDRTIALTDQIGKLGLEFSQNRLLRGTDGKETYEVNALGKRQKKIDNTAPISGQSLQTTLDPYLSEVAYRALGNKKGSVVILDADTGQVLTLVSSPSYNPNLLTHTQSTVEAEAERRRAVQALFTDPRQLFFNRAVGGSYPPGSVFKIVTALAGLESGKIDAETTVEDEGVLKVGIYEYGNWFFRQYGRVEGTISLVRAIARSNDIYFYKAAELMGPDTLAQMASMMGFGKTTTIEVTAQAKGLVPTPQWKEETIGERWFLGNTYHYGIGQGDTLVSPIQVAQMTQVVANEGTLCPPSLLASGKNSCWEVGIKPENLQLVLQGMLDACSAGGTAFPFFPYNTIHRVEGATPDEDLQRGAVACKTGTAEFGAADELDRRRTHGWFTATLGFDPSLVALDPVTEAAPIPSGVITKDVSLASLRHGWLELVTQKPLPRRLVLVAMVESDEEAPFKEGSRDAAPVVKQIVDWMIDFDKVASGSSTPVVEVVPGTGE